MCSAIKSVLEDSTFILKEQQRNAIKAFVDRKDAVLPTGSGKSLMYQLALVTYRRKDGKNIFSIDKCLDRVSLFLFQNECAVDVFQNRLEN